MDRRYIDNFPWSLFWVTFALVAIGLLNLYSAVYFWGESGSLAIFWSQLLWTIVGIALMLLCTFIDYRLFRRFAIPMYLVICALLLLAIIIGKTVRGTQGWLQVGPLSLQPTEFAKTAYILVAARFFADNPNPDGYSLAELWHPALLMVVPFTLIVIQGDLGSSFFFILIFMSMSLFAKIRTKTLLVCIAIGLIAVASVYSFGLKGYQRNRIMNFMNPEADVRGSGYHLVQSKIAVGSGRIFGKGYLKGNINKLQYLPERHTDFIFPVFAEEWGFAGSLVVLGLYTALIMMGIETGARSRDRFGSFAAIGIASLLFWQVTINLGGVLGLMP
ncbi:MAG: FtsW/RodA/SpoVE family cell cycle protein, partial [Pseudomonadota bacterium]